MKFQVPQFIEIEDKIFGPLTFKQFLYLGGGAGLIVILWTFLPRLIGLPLIAGAAALAGALAFYKVNSKPFAEFLEASIRYALGNKLYIWKKIPKKVSPKAAEDAAQEAVYIPKISDSKLKDLAWSLDVHNINKTD